MQLALCTLRLEWRHRNQGRLRDFARASLKAYEISLADFVKEMSLIEVPSHPRKLQEDTQLRAIDMHLLRAVRLGTQSYCSFSARCPVSSCVDRHRLVFLPTNS